MNMHGVNRRLRKLEKIMGDGKITHVSVVKNADGSYDCTCYGTSGDAEIHIATQEEFDKWLASDPIARIPVMVDDICCMYTYHSGEFHRTTERDDL
jgi:hypothetical protein